MNTEVISQGNVFSVGIWIQVSCSFTGEDTLLKDKPWRRKWQPTPVFLPGKVHGQRSLAG